MRVSVSGLLLALTLTSRAELPYSDFDIVARHPHDPEIFTQGLAYHEGRLFQSSGLRKRSLALVGPAGSLEVEASFHFPKRYFAEGLTLVDDEVIVLTWQAGEALVLDRETLQLRRKFNYSGEGWGLAYDGRQLWLSDGSARLRRYQPTTMQALGSLEVRDDSGAVRRLNELEYVDGLILANIWHSTRLVAIDPQSGSVVAQWDLQSLVPQQRNFGRDSVANGIAYDPVSGHVWLTGKGWPILYEVRLNGLPTN